MIQKYKINQIKKSNKKPNKKPNKKQNKCLLNQLNKPNKLMKK